MKFEFSAPDRIVFGAGSFARLASLASGLGRRPLLVAGRRRAPLAPLVEELGAAGAAVTELEVAGEPSTDSIEAGLALARGSGCDLVIAVGGGSVLDTGKAIAALLRQEGGLFDYLEVIGRARPLAQPKAPLVAAPTTAGTGAEATCNAVVFSPAHRVKVSLRHPELFPTIALVDPALTHSLPPAQTAASGLDALTQLIEPFTTPAAQPFTDALCRDGIARAGRSLRRVFAAGTDAEAREDMALASLESGIALTNARLGAVHGLAGPLGGLTGAPHGRLCAALLPAVLEANVRLLQKRGDGAAILARYDEVGRLLTGNERAGAGEAVAWVRETCRMFRIEKLSALGLKRSDVPALVEKAKQASSMKGNPAVLSAEEIEAIVDSAY
jgi:alcohol dehydrogenase class IV